MIHNLIDLAELKDDRQYLLRAAQDVASFADYLVEHPGSLPHLLVAMLRLNELMPDWPKQIDNTGPKNADGPKSETAGPTPPGNTQNPVDYEVTYKQQVDGAWQVVMHLQVEPDYHLYAPGNDESLGKAVELLLMAPSDVQVEPHFPAGEVWQPAPQLEPARIYRERVAVSMLIDGVKPEDEIDLLLRYQACTTSACLPVQEQTIKVKLSER
jgi:hypothetical protein